MSFGSILGGIYHAITPWHDSGAVFSKSSYQAPKKKRPEDQPGYQPPRVQAPSQPQQFNQPQLPRPQRPDNLFAGLNQNLLLGNRPGAVPVLNNNQPKPAPAPGTVIKPTDIASANATPEAAINRGLDAGKSWETISKENNIDINHVRKYSQATRPNYGITPHAPAAYKPPSFWRTLRDTAVGSVANLPEVALAAGRTATGIVQGAANLPHDVTALAAGGTQQIQKHFNNPFTRQVNRGFQDVNTGVKKATHYVVNDTFDPLNRGLDRAAKFYERKVPVAAGGAGVYRATQVPLNALAALVTLGGAEVGAAGEAGETASDVSKLARARSFISDLLNKPLTSNEDNLISRTGRSVMERGRPVSEALNAPVRTAGNIINRFRAGVDTGEIGNILSDADLNDLTTRNIPVSQGVDVNAPPSEGVNIPVRNGNTPSSLIQEVGGDAKTATTNAEAASRAINARRVEAAKKADTVIHPDPGIEGVRPFRPGADTITRNEIQAERDALDQALANKEITKTAHKAANDALDNTPAAGEVPKGNPITVKEVQGIDVADQTNVPQNLPETPGKVRVTTATAPSNAKSEAVAAQTPSAAPVPPEVPPTGETIPGATPAETAVKGAAAENLPGPGESDETFLKRVATDMQSNIKRAVTALKTTKQMTKAERAQRAAAGQKAYEEAKAAGLSPGAQEAARKGAYGGSFDRQDYVGTPVHGDDEQRLRDMVDSHYADMPYQAGNVREAFTKLFHAGEPGWASEAGNHIVPSDIKNIRKFLNESVPDVEGNGGLGDFAESAIKELADEGGGAGKVANAIGLQRALRFTADISATGRQALPGALSHPVEFAKAAKKSFEVMFSHEKYQKLVSSLANDKEANYINDRLGAYLSVMNDDVSKADDIYRNSEWAHKIPGVNKVVAASERQYNTLLSMMRYYGGKRFIDAAGGIGNLEKVASDSGNADEFLKAIGTVTNVNTGRGFGKALDTGASKVLSDVLVSPRGLAAKIQRFNPKYYTDLAKTNPAAAKEALRSLTIQTAVTAGALGAANKAGIYEDGQIKVGNTRYDITGGAANMVRTVVRVAQYINGNRETTPFNNAEDEVTKWARNQLAPFLSSSLDAIGLHQDPKTGDWINKWGDQVTPGSELLNNIAPVNASQVETDRQLGTPGSQQAINAGLNTLGIGVNSYESSADKNLPKDQSVRDMFKQLTKEGIGTSSTDVNNYIASNDFDKASKAAQYNLAALKATPNTSSNVIKKAEQTVQEVNLRQQGVPMTDDGIQAKVEDGNWDAAIQGYKWKIEKAKGDGEISKKTEGAIQTDIKRAETARDKQIAPEALSAYKGTTLSEWRAMGNPKSDNYDPKAYQELWNLDQTLAKAGASYKLGEPSKSKYSAKDSGSGRGSGRRRSVPTGFGELKAGSFAPRVQQYDTIDTKSGAVPHIGIVRPNIVHNISSSG